MFLRGIAPETAVIRTRACPALSLLSSRANFRSRVPMPSVLRRALYITFAALLALSACLAGLTAATVTALPLIARHVPLEMGRVLLSDGRRQVELQGMVHVASSTFFAEIAEHVAARRREGWLVFFEEVRNDLEDPRKGVSDVLSRLGAEWDATADQHPYELIAPMLGVDLVLQNNSTILGAPGPELRNVDLSMSQLLALLPPSPPPPSDMDRQGKKEPLDLDDARRMFEELPAWAQTRVQAAIQIVLATSTSGKLAQQIFPPAITAEREKLVVDAIRAEPGRNVLILYGQAHLDAIWRQLKSADPNWHVLSRETVRAF